VSVHLRIPSKSFDALDAHARHERASMPETTRRMLAAWLREHGK
jgi:hypothetical protein